MLVDWADKGSYYSSLQEANEQEYRRVIEYRLSRLEQRIDSVIDLLAKHSKALEKMLDTLEGCKQ